MKLNRLPPAVRALEYRAKSGPRSYRFSPHTLVDTSSRPHFRGYAADPVTETGLFIDLVPSRVSQVLGANSDVYVSYESDNEWIRRVDLRFQLREDMEESLRETISWEYDIPDGSLVFYSVRAALALYVIRQLLERRVEGRSQPIFTYIGPNPSLSSFDEDPE